MCKRKELLGYLKLIVLKFLFKMSDNIRYMIFWGKWILMKFIWCGGIFKFSCDMVVDKMVNFFW